VLFNGYISGSSYLPDSLGNRTPRANSIDESRQNRLQGNFELGIRLCLKEFRDKFSINIEENHPLMRFFF
jgi:hypothetical protein